MSSFGTLLRFYRKKCRPSGQKGRFTQGQLGQSLADYPGGKAVSAAAVAAWEADKARIRPQDRDRLLAIIQTFRRYGAMSSPDEANELLAAGNYRDLDEEELQLINPNWLGLAGLTVGGDPRPTEFDPYAAAPRLDDVARYLPHSLRATLELAPVAHWPGIALPYLNELLAAAATFVPRQLALAILKNPQPIGASASGQFLEGTLLLANITGFSGKINDHLTPADPEELQSRLNGFLDTMLGILYRHKGQLIRFDGQSMLALFGGDQQGALTAVQAAWEMKKKLAAQFDDVELFEEVAPLSMKIGHSAGRLFAIAAGSERRVDSFLTGSAAEYTARAEAAAGAGDIVISQESLNLIDPYLKVEPLPDQEEFFRVQSVPSQPRPASIISAWGGIAAILKNIGDNMWAIIDRLDALAPYLPTGILSELIKEPGIEVLAGQYRRVSILAAGFQGMNELVNRLSHDPAQLSQAINEFMAALQEEIEYYGGVSTKMDLIDQGNKLLVLFGAPFAHERDARRAALTALGMQQVSERLSSTAAGPFLLQGIGLHAGTVFAGTVGAEAQHRHEYALLGETVSRAEQLMAGGRNGEIRVSAVIWDQIRAEFATEVASEEEAEGTLDVGETSEVSEVYRLAAQQAIDETARQLRPLYSPLIGRQAELESLSRLLDSLLFGQGKQIVAVTGDGGAGKSRLLWEWRRNTVALGEEDQTRWLTGHARSFGQRTNAVFVDVLRQLLDIQDEDSSSERWDRLTGYLARSQETAGGETSGSSLRHQSAYLGSFLNFDLSLKPGYEELLAHLPGEQAQLGTRLAYADLLTYAAGEKPIVLILEDLHWADEASIELLTFLLDRLDDQFPILFCLVFRSEKDRAIWQAWAEISREYPNPEHLQVRELAPANARKLLNNLLPGGERIDDALLELIHDETDGNPLYIEEVVHHLLEEDLLLKNKDRWSLKERSERIKVPGSLYQIVQSRIDDLDFYSPGVRRALWIMAVLGRRFTRDILESLFAAAGRDPAELDRHLRALRNANMIARARVIRGGQLAPGFEFHHGLVQQVAYENMPHLRRRLYHRLVGEWIEQSAAGSLPEHVTELAHHFDRAQVWDKAFRYTLLVGKQDRARFANASAERHLRRALVLAGPARPTSLEVAEVHYHLGRTLFVGGDFDQALIELRQTDDLLASRDDAAGRPTQARTAYEIGRLYELQGEDLDKALYWQGRGLGLLSEEATVEGALLHVLGGITQLRLGNWDAVAEEGRQALALAEAIGEPETAATAHRLLSVYWHVQGDLAQAMNHAQASIEASEGISNWLGQIKGYLNRGVYAFELDDWPAAESSYEQAVTLLERTGDQYELGRALLNLADLKTHQGKSEEAEQLARQGLALAEKMNAGQQMIIGRTILAILAWRKNNYDEAASELAKAEELLTSLPMFVPTASRWSAQLSLDQGNVDAAAALIQPLLDEDEEVLADEQEPLQWLQATIENQQGDPEAAVARMEESLGRLEAANMRYQAAQAKVGLAKLLAKGGRTKDAQQLALSAHDTFANLGAGFDLLDIEQFLASL